MTSPEIYHILDACRRGDIDEIKTLIDTNVSLLNAEDHKGFTPLIIAVYNHQPEVVEFLLEKGADTNKQDLSGNSALMGVAFKGYTELAQKLMDAGADVNLRNGQGATA